MLPKTVSLFYPSNAKFAEGPDPRVLALQSAGYGKFVLGAMEDFLEKPELLAPFRRKMEKEGIVFTDCHTPCSSNQWMMNCGVPEQRTLMLQGFARCLEICADFGIPRAVIHIGNTDHCREAHKDIAWARDLTCDALERLLPVAEKNNVIICIENTLFRTDTTQELLFYLRKFPTKFLGVCFDSGHANVMEPAPGKTSEMMQDWIQARWDPVVEYETNILGKLLDHIVTCHLHDNHGTHDEHLIPGTGTINWDELLATLAKAPNLQSLQDESHWAYSLDDVAKDIAFWNNYLPAKE